MKNLKRVMSLALTMVVLLCVLPVVPSVSAAPNSLNVNDITNIEFFAARDLYRGEYPEMGLAANISYRDGTVYYCDFGYRIEEEYLDTYGAINNDIVSEELFNLFDFEVVPEHSTDTLGWINIRIILDDTYNIYPKINFTYNKTVVMKVVENPVESIEVIGGGISLDPNKEEWIDNGYYDENDDWIDNSYMGYSEYDPIDIQINYADGRVKLYSDMCEECDGISGVIFDGESYSWFLPYDLPFEGADERNSRHEFRFISNQDENHWTTGNTYPVTVTYMGCEATYYVTITENELPQRDDCTSLELNEMQGYYYHPEEGEEIYFIYDADYDRKLRFYSSPNPDDYDLRVTVFDSQMNRIAEDNDSGINKNFSVVFDTEAEKTYYFVVSGFDNNEGCFRYCLSDYELANPQSFDDRLSVPVKAVNKRENRCYVYTASQNQTMIFVCDSNNGFVREGIVICDNEVVAEDYGFYIEVALEKGKTYYFIVKNNEDNDEYTINLYDNEVMDFAYNMENGSVTIHGYYGNKTDLIIPRFIRGLPVTRIGGISKEELTSIEMPDTILSIGSYAFWGCKNLVNIFIPESVTNIEEYAFFGCTGLTSVTIPVSVRSIGDKAFGYSYDNNWNEIKNENFIVRGYEGSEAERYANDNGFDFESLGSAPEIPITGTTGDCIWTLDGTELTISGNGRMEQYYTPWGNNITKVTILDGVTNIGAQAFYDCDELTEFIIPDSVTSIGKNAISGCISLINISFPETITAVDEGALWNTAWYDNQPDGLVYIGKVLYEDKGYCSTEAEIRKGTVSISDYAFLNNNDLERINIPDSVTNIGNHAFRNCSALTEVTIPDSVITIGWDAFIGCSSLTSVTIPESVISIGGMAFGYIYDNNWNEIKNETFIVKGYAGSEAERYANDNGFVFESLGNAPETPRTGTTGDCTWTLDGTELTISGNGEMGDYSWENEAPWGENISKATIENGVTRIGNRAFVNCSILTSIDFPDSITSIGDYAFASCLSLSEVTFPDSMLTIGEWAFHDCQSINQITIPATVTSIGSNALGYYTFESEGEWNTGKVNDYIIHGYKGTEAERYANENDFVFVSLDVPITGTTGDCTWTLDGTELTISGNGEMGDYSWENEAPWGIDITKVTILDGVTNIVKYAFFGCKELTEVIIPDTVTSIGREAFSSCTSLMDISFPDTITAVGLNALNGTAWYNNQPDGLVYIGRVLYKTKGNCSTEVEIRKGTVSITDWACCGSEITKINIPDSVVTIGEYAFCTCWNLSEVIIGRSVSEIGDYAFLDCLSLKQVTILSNHTEFGTEAIGYWWNRDNNWEDEPMEDFTIYGYEHSSSYYYAINNGLLFVKLPKRKLGDADGDGNVTSIDVTMIKRYCALMDVGVDESVLMNADVDGNGILDIIDATYIQRYLAFMDTPYAIGEAN